MKYFPMLFCILFTFSLYAQKQSDIKNSAFYKIQGGLFFDEDFRNDYTGFNTLNMGLARIKNGHLEGFDLDLIYYKDDAEIISSNNPSVNFWNRKRASVDLTYFRSFSVIGDIDNGFFIGPSGSVGYIKNRFTSTVSSTFPRSNKCLCFGLGVKADYYYKLSEKLF